MVVCMKLAQLNTVMAEVKQAIPAKKQQDNTMHIVNAQAFGNAGEYNIAVKRIELDQAALEKIMDIVDKYKLSVRGIGDYLILYRT